MSTKLFVGNISWDATEDDVRAAFEEAGFTVVSVNFIKDRESQRPKGFGFVELEDADADAVIEAMNDKEIMGRAIFVDKAREQKPRD